MVQNPTMAALLFLWIAALLPQVDAGIINCFDHYDTCNYMSLLHQIISCSGYSYCAYSWSLFCSYEVECAGDESAGNSLNYSVWGVCIALLLLYKLTV